jgi:hypothetical protein
MVTKIKAQARERVKEPKIQSTRSSVTINGFVCDASLCSSATAPLDRILPAAVMAAAEIPFI